MALSGGGGNNFNYSNSNNDAFNQAFKRAFEKLSDISIAIIAAVIFFLIIVFIILLVARYIAHAGIISSVDDIESRKEANLKTGFENGWHYWLRLIGVDILVFIATSIISSVIIIVFLILAAILLGPGIALIVFKKLVIGIILTVIGGLITLALLIDVIVAIFSITVVITLLTYYWQRFIIVGKEPFFESLNKSIDLFKNKTTPSLALWLVIIAIGIVTGIPLFIIILLFAIPVVVVAFINVIAAIVIAIPLLLIYIFMLGLITAYIQIYLTVAFKELTAETVTK